MARKPNEAQVGIKSFLKATDCGDYFLVTMKNSHTDETVQIQLKPETFRYWCKQCCDLNEWTIIGEV